MPSWEERFRSRRLVPAIDAVVETPDIPWRDRAKTSLDVRNWQETTKRFYGDPARAAQYLPIAQLVLGGLIHQLRLGGIEVGQRVVNLPDGTRIRAMRVGGQNIIEIVSPGVVTEESRYLISVFMETGYLDITPIFPLWDGDKDAAKLYYGNKQLNEYQKSPSRFDWLARDSRKRKYTPGMDSLAVSSTYLPEDKDKPEGERRENPVRSSDKRYWIAPGFDGEHPNNRTGKLKLLLQAKLGRMDVPDMAVIMGLDSINNTVGLFTHKFGVYSLLVISGGGAGASATIYPVQVNSALRSALASPKVYGEIDDRIKEAYLLSTAVLDQENKYHLSTPGEVKGEPFAYGWKFNYSGDKASIVTSEIVYENNNPEGRILWHHQRLYTITIGDQEITNDGQRRWVINSLSLVLSEDGVCTPRLRGDNLWFPSRYEGTPMLSYHYWETSAFPGRGRYVELRSCGGVPMYCWYDEDQTLRVVRYDLELNNGQPITRNWLDLYTCGAGEASTQDRGISAYAVGRFYIDNAIEMPSDPLDSPGSTVTWTMEAFENPDPRYNGAKEVICRYPISYTGCNGQQVGLPRDSDCIAYPGDFLPKVSKFGLVTAAFSSIEQTTAISAFTGSLLVISFGCAESAYIGVARSSGKLTTTKLYSGGGRPLEILGPHAGKARVSGIPGFGVTGYEKFRGWENRRELLIALSTQHKANLPIEENRVTYSSSLKISGSVRDAVYSVESSGSLEEWERGAGDWGYLFAPELFGPEAFPYYRALYTYESDGGELTYHDSKDLSLAYGTTDDNFPYTDFISYFVGWI